MNKQICCKIENGDFVDILKVKPNDFASQLTLRDLPVFQRITAEELMSGAWTDKSRNELASNIVEFTYRFNMICLWCQRTILSAEKASKRAEYIEHFLKIAKALILLNNIHGCFAIISALLSQSIYRLSKTWDVSF
uniref:Ras-GEF domain-containing protein n=1 Tax=Panagrolaimus sp. JU765 TaxID=591449 RepID=A0AC34RAX2_9BILA